MASGSNVQMPDKRTERPMSGDDYIQRLRKDVAKRRLERAAKRNEKRPVNQEEKKQEEKKISHPKTAITPVEIVILLSSKPGTFPRGLTSSLPTLARNDPHRYGLFSFSLLKQSSVCRQGGARSPR